MQLHKNKKSYLIFHQKKNIIKEESSDLNVFCSITYESFIISFQELYFSVNWKKVEKKKITWQFQEIKFIGWLWIISQ